jgi:ABC-type phosphate transport system auxiliary subunit
MNDFWRKGEPFIWTTAAALATTLLLAAVLIVVVLVNGLGVFWPSRVAVAELHDGSRVMGEVIRREAIFDGEGQRVQFKIGNRDLYGLDFRWVDQADIARMSFPDDAIVLERQEYGNFYGSLAALEGQPVTSPAQGWTGLRQRLQELARGTGPHRRNGRQVGRFKWPGRASAHARTQIALSGTHCRGCPGGVIADPSRGLGAPVP